MKKLIGIAIVLAAIAGLTLAGAAMAQAENPGNGGRAPGDGSGLLHDYMEAAMADAVGLSVEEFEARHDAGESFYQIALSEGFAAEEIPALMQDARAKAIDAAAADGVITRRQAEWMKSHGPGRGSMMGRYGYGPGYGSGTCPMADGDEVPAGGQFGPGMMGGGRWGQAPQ
jgi:hypothetical protein